MVIRSVPPFLLTQENLEVLIRLLIEKEKLRRSIKVRDFGPRVMDSEEAARLFAQVVRSTRRVLDLNSEHGNKPRLVLTGQLSQLYRQTVVSYLFLLPLALLLFYLGFRQSPSGPLFYIIPGTILFLLSIPLSLHRRTRIHVEHQCKYRKDAEGEGEIIIDQLPSIQFQSYLVHEYAHHIYALQREGDQRWVREGWARLVQWQVSNDLKRLEENPAYLYHVLRQVIGELKFACQIIASALGVRLPVKVRGIRTIFHSNPLFTLLTGTPATRTIPMIDHAIGTASHFLAMERRGPEAALHEDLLALLQG